MSTMTQTAYKTDEKKDFTPAEFVRAKTACEFVIDLTKAISRSGYYDAQHPVSHEVKKGLYDAFISALGDSAEIMLTCHNVEEQVDIHISGILEEPFNIRKLTHATTSDLFVPKLKDYFERKNLNSFVIKKQITSGHFESFIDVMSEPIAESADVAQLGDYLTKALADLDITEVSTVFKTDIVLARGKLPWRVSIILRRLAKDLKVIPMFRSATEDKMKQVKKQIVEDIIRPLHKSDLLRDLIVNCDVIVNHITHLLEIDELENMIISSLPHDAVVAVSHAVFDVYQDNKENDHEENRQRNAYLSKVLNIAARRMVAENIPETVTLFEKLYEEKIIDIDMLPEKMRFDVQSRKLAGEIISGIDSYIEKTTDVSSLQDMETLVKTFQRIMPELIRKKEWRITGRIVNALNDMGLRKADILKASPSPLDLPDAILEGAEDIFVGEYIQADKDIRDVINAVLMQLQTMCMKIINGVLQKSKDPDILKSAMDVLSKQGETARQWSLKMLDDPSQSLSTMNIALLLMPHVGQSEDSNLVKKFLKHPNGSIRGKALSAIVKLNPKDAAPPVLDALNDSEEKVRNQAAILMEHDLSLTVDSLKRLLLFLKEKLRKKDITSGDAIWLSGLIKAVGKNKDYPDKGLLEDEMIGIASDLISERKGLLKFIKSEPGREQQDILSACASVLGRIGGAKSKDFLKKLSDGDTPLSHSARQAMEEMNKHPINR